MKYFNTFGSIFRKTSQKYSDTKFTCFYTVFVGRPCFAISLDVNFVHCFINQA